MAIIYGEFASHIVDSIDQFDDRIDDATSSFNSKSGTCMDDTVVHSTDNSDVELFDGIKKREPVNNAPNTVTYTVKDITPHIDPPPGLGSNTDVWHIRYPEDANATVQNDTNLELNICIGDDNLDADNISNDIIDLNSESMIPDVLNIGDEDSSDSCNVDPVNSSDEHSNQCGVVP